MYPLKPGTHHSALAAHTLKARFDRSYEIITFGSDRYVLHNITLTRRSIRESIAQPVKGISAFCLPGDKRRSKGPAAQLIRPGSDHRAAGKDLQ